MKMQGMFFALTLACASVWGEEKLDHKTQRQGEAMNYSIEHQDKKFFIGYELRTNNEECSTTISAHKDKFFKENMLAKIPNKVNGNILALYTDYEGDYSKPYSWILGCEVSSLNQVPEGLVGKTIPASSYAVFTTEGQFPQGLIATWHEIWKTPLRRTYTTDFEVYQNTFDPQQNPEVKVYIAIDALSQAVWNGMLDTFRSASLYSPLPHAEYKETSQNSVYAWGIDYVCGNGVIEKQPDRVPTEKEIDGIIEHFTAHNLPFMWWTSAKILETKGFQFGGALTGIALDISQGIPAEIHSPLNLTIKTVETESDLKIFTEIFANTFGISPKASLQWLELNRALMQKEKQVSFLAYAKDIPVGTLTLSVSPTSAGIWNLATLPEFRKQGIGGSLVHAALLEAKKRHYNQMMAILMPKGLAWGLFTQLGFKKVSEFPFYIYGLSPEDLEK